MSEGIDEVKAFDPDQVRLVREGTAAEHFISLISEETGVITTPEDADNCRASAAEDIAILLGCSDEYALAMVGYLECEMMWEGSDGQA